jgi:DNA-binding response OmpR family regulator
VTGHASPDTEDKIRSLGADAYLEKPFERRELKACIDQLIS